MKLPKLYTAVWCKIEYVHNYCVNGDHDQRAGDYWLKVRRVLDTDLGWKWTPVVGPSSDYDYYPDHCKREILSWLWECSGNTPDGELQWSLKHENLQSSWKEPDGYY
jgi:hypothetical protein